MKSIEIFFKAKRTASQSAENWRAIAKRGDLKYDLAGDSDDVICIDPSAKMSTIKIDCDKKTGEFRLFFSLLS